MGFWSKFKEVAERMGPIALEFTPLAPIAPFVTAGIVEANSMAGADGPTKLQHVLNVAENAARAVNADADRIVVDPQVVKASGAEIISAVYQSIKAVHQVAASGTPATPAAAAQADGAGV